MFFAKLAILHETSLKNSYFGNAAIFREILKNIASIEPSPTWEAQNHIFDISNKIYMFDASKCKIALSPRR